MSDENPKDRRPQRGPGRAATAPAGAKRTMIGLPISDPRVQPEEPARGGHRPEPAPAKPAGALDDGYIADKLYMDPPSETFGRAPTHRAIPAPQHSAPAARVAPAQPEPEPAPAPAPNFAATALRAAQPERGGGHNPAGAALHAAQQTMQERIPAPRTSFSNPAAPEAWRNDVRRMADRGASHAPRTSGAANPGLRLKLDAADPEDHYRGVPKSRLPSVLFWLFVLTGVGGAAAYWVDEQGGLVAARTRLEGVVSGRPIPAAAPTTPPAEAPAQPATPPPTAAAEPATPPPAAAGTQPPTQPPTQHDHAAQALADPEPPTEAAKPAPAEAKPKPPEEKPKPSHAEAKPKPAAPAPPRKVVRHEPVLTVKPIGSSSAAPPSAPPEPPGMPYVPNIPEPPAPDDNR